MNVIRALIAEDDIGIRCLGKLCAAHKFAGTDGTAILHHQAAKFAGILYAFKCNGPVFGRRRAACEHKKRNQNG